MSKKTKSKRPDHEFLFQRAERELNKGNAKEALKDARQCFRAEPTNAHRNLLERAYVARVETLMRSQFEEQARELLKELVDFGPTVSEVQQQVPRLQVLLGIAAAQSSGAAAAPSDPALLVMAADQLLLRPQSSARVPDAIRQEATLVREALEAVERGEDDVANEKLQSISRQSPFADWRMFVRGLSAWYQGDAERRRMNWDRLDANRPAHRIARTLLARDDAALAKAAPELSLNLRRLEQGASEAGIVSYLLEAKTALEREEYGAFAEKLRGLRQRHGEEYPRIVDRMVSIGWRTAFRTGNRQLFERVLRSATPPRDDRNWSITRALFEEQFEQGDGDQFMQRWETAVAEIESNDFWKPEDRAIAVGLIYKHIAEDIIGFLRSRFSGHWPVEYESAQDAVRQFERSLQACPQLRETYQEYARFYLRSTDPEKALEIYERLLLAFPDDFEAANYLAHHYLQLDEPGRSERYVRVVATLRPRSKDTLKLRWDQHLAMVRQCVRSRKFEQARSEMAEAESAACAPLYLLTTVRAGIEFRAKNEEKAREHLAAATASIAEPTVIWLVLAYLVERFGIDKHWKKEFQENFRKGIGQVAMSETAGQLCGFLAAIVDGDVEYMGRATHIKLVQEYLARSRRIAWRPEDLDAACVFLGTCENSEQNWADLAERGQKEFPERPQFHYWRGYEQFCRGPLRCDRTLAVDCLKRALELSATSPTPLTESQVSRAQQTISDIDDSNRMESRFSFSYLDDYDDEDEEDYDEDEDGEDLELEDLFDPRIFQDPDNVRVFEAVERLRESGADMDPDTLFDELTRVFGNREKAQQKFLKFIAAMGRVLV